MTCYLLLKYVDKGTKREIEELNSMFNDLGLQFEFSGDDMLKIETDYGKYLKRARRSAGRKQKSFSEGYTYGDVRRWKKEGKKVEEIISILKIPRATFYRRMKAAEENNYSDNWYFS